jgi:MinD-like ATPase involved in chromosome partitioning or flagellar assembly
VSREKEVQVSDQPSQGGEAPHGNAGDPQTNQFSSSADSDEHESFGGFRNERRFVGPAETSVPGPDQSGSQPRAWEAAPSGEFPAPVDHSSSAYYNASSSYYGPSSGYYSAPSSGYYSAPSSAYYSADLPAMQMPHHGSAGPAAPAAPYSDLSTGSLLRQFKPPPSGGWRRLLYQLSGHLVNVGESRRTVRYNDLLVQADRPVQDCYRVALLSLKGGVGKTTITATLGATFASIRGDRVVAVDANPDRGTLSQKVPMETPATVRHLLRDADGIQRYSDVRSYTNQGPSRLEVLASETDPAASQQFSAEEYARTLQVLEQFYSLVLTDCGTGLLHSAMSAVLDQADTLIVVSSGSVDGARSASATLDWLDAHGHEDLVKQSIAVINGVRPRSGKVDMQKVVDHFARRCRAVRLVPFDPHLEEGAEIHLERLKRETREALVELAALVAEGFPGNERSHYDFL